MKKLFLIPALIFLFAFVGCAPAGNQSQVQVNVQAEQPDLSDSLDLQAVGVQAQKARSAEDLERIINDPATGLNNLDLDGKGAVNYINVEEVDPNAGSVSTNSLSATFLTSYLASLTTLPAGSPRVFRLTTKLADGTVIELARITIQAVSNSQTQVAVTGNAQLYPQNNQYVSTVNSSDLLLWAYLLTPHPYFYHPYYYYGHYPSTYHYYAPVSRTVYHTRTTTYTKTYGSSYKPSTVRTPQIKQAPLSNFNSSQKPFTTRSVTKPIGSGGFGGTGSVSKPSPSVSRPSVSRPASQTFGGKR